MFDFVLSRISMIWMFIFFLFFLPHSIKRWKVLSLFGICFILCTVCDYFLILQKSSVIAGIANILLEGIAIQLTVFAVCKYHDGRALFVGLTGAAYVLLGGMIGKGIHVFWSDRFFAGLLIASIANFFILLFLCIKLHRAFIRQLERQDSIWIKLCVIPLLFYFLVYSITIWPADIDECPQNLLGAMLMMVLMLISYTILFGAMDSYEKYQRQKYDIVLMERYAAGMRQQLEIMRINNEKNAILRHDMRHQVMVISGYLHNREYQKLEKIMEKTLSQLEELKSEIFCENVAVNSIVAQYAAQARRANVEFRCEADIPSTLPVDEVEFAVVLSNLLSNAVREAGADKEHRGMVQIYACRVKEQLALEISNTFANEVEFGEDKLPRSRRGEGHGYGSRSVQAFMRKYGAVYDYQVEDGLFTVRLAIFLMKP